MGQQVSIISTETGKEVSYTLNQCFINAVRNRDNGYKELNLRLVIGSLGLNEWFEFGGKDWKTTKDWIVKGRKAPGTWDAHGWLEDEEGNVYDFVFDDYLNISDIRNGRGLLKAGIVEKKSKKQCERMGLTYIAAPQPVQEIILRDLEKAGRFD
jgi:hypothetical protein